MPNHITNIFDVTGPKEDVEAFKAKVYSEPLSEEDGWKRKKGTPHPFFNFNSTVPMPKELEGTSSPAQSDEEKKHQSELEAKFGAGNWYDWSTRNWGTKWGGYDAEKPVEIKAGIRFQFNTAWCPPDAWIFQTAKLYPTLKFIDHWKDEGGGCGVLIMYCDKEFDEVMQESEELTDHEWYLEFEPEYRKIYLTITEGDYKEVLAYANEVEDGEGWDYGYMLEPFLLERLQDIDLPLFINFEWSGKCQRVFEERLKGVKDAIPPTLPKQ